MTITKSKRIESIDILRGLVMVIMALDHVRDYFHLNALYTADPENLDTTTPFLFFTRFITHYCAPVFIFLAGTSACLYGQNKSKKDVSKFLITRGAWLVFVEIVIMNFIWWFDPSYSFINLQVIWAIGICMITLGLLVLLPKRLILVLGLLIVFGHNLLDDLTIEKGILWSIIHEAGFFPLENGKTLIVAYPIIPWIGVMSLGYYFGTFYDSSKDPLKRQKMFKII